MVDQDPALPVVTSCVSVFILTFLMSVSIWQHWCFQPSWTHPLRNLDTAPWFWRWFCYCQVIPPFGRLRSDQILGSIAGSHLRLRLYNEVVASRPCCYVVVASLPLTWRNAWPCLTLGNHGGFGMSVLVSSDLSTPVATYHSLQQPPNKTASAFLLLRDWVPCCKQNVLHGGPILALKNPTPNKSFLKCQKLMNLQGGPLLYQL